MLKTIIYYAIFNAFFCLLAVFICMGHIDIVKAWTIFTNPEYISLRLYFVGTSVTMNAVFTCFLLIYNYEPSYIY